MLQHYLTFFVLVFAMIYYFNQDKLKNISVSYKS
jgi:hypothetical protein